LLDTVGQSVTTHFGHYPISHHQIKMAGFELRQSFAFVGCGLSSMSVSGEIRNYDLADEGVVIDDEDVEWTRYDSCTSLLIISCHRFLLFVYLETILHAARNCAF
jgi:hypothetical protein